jgi:hypothetical protein
MYVCPRDPTFTSTPVGRCPTVCTARSRVRMVRMPALLTPAMCIRPPTQLMYNDDPNARLSNRRVGVVDVLERQYQDRLAPFARCVQFVFSKDPHTGCVLLSFFGNKRTSLLDSPSLRAREHGSHRVAVMSDGHPISHALPAKQTLPRRSPSHKPTHAFHDLLSTHHPPAGSW